MSSLKYFRSISSLVSLLEELYVTVAHKKRNNTGGEVTEILLQETHEVAQSAGSKLLVLLVDWGLGLDKHADTAASYNEFLKSKSIIHLGCVHPQQQELEMRLEGDIPPNEKVNTFWAACIEPRMLDIIS